MKSIRHFFQCSQTTSFLPKLCFTLLGIFFLSGTLLLNSAAAETLSDRQIEDALELDLLLSDRVSSHMINVDCNDGIVTLSGSIDNLLARDQAVRIAESVRDVRSVVENITVKPVARTDQAIKDDIEKAFQLDPAAESYEVAMSVTDGIVTMSGQVESWAEKNLAASLVKGVKGVIDLRNDVAVSAATDRAPEEIQAEVERKLEINPYLNAGLLSVEVNDETVVLSGTVGSAAERTEAMRAAWVVGVNAIKVDDVTVDPTLNERMTRENDITIRSDSQIKKAIEDALLYDPRTMSFKIDVEVENGTVSLYGTVDNLKAKRAARADAVNTVGVWTVSNFIKVRPEATVTDEAISENVRSALYWDPVVERFDIDVLTRNNKVYLMGEVDTYYEKVHAEEIAAGIYGVADVHNSIEVEIASLSESDVKIRKDIQDELQWSLFVDGDDITVTVDDGVATLTGQVDNWQEYTAAIKNAFDGGAIGVENQLTVIDVTDADLPAYYTVEDYREMYPGYYSLF